MPAPETWLIAGASGMLGQELCRHLSEAGHRVVGTLRSHQILVSGVQSLPLDLVDDQACDGAIAQVRPAHVVHSAGLTNVDECEQDEARAMALNAKTAWTLGSAAARHGASFTYISTDQLWDGSREFITEEEPPAPLNAYGRSKAEGERAAQSAHPAALVARTNFFGRGLPWKSSFSDWVEQNLRAGKPISGFADVFFTPVASALLVRLLSDLIGRKASGIYNVIGGERLSKYDAARRIAIHLGLGADLVGRSSVNDAKFAARRPNEMSLSTRKISHFLGRAMPSFDESLATLAVTPAVNT